MSVGQFLSIEQQFQLIASVFDDFDRLIVIELSGFVSVDGEKSIADGE